MSQKRTGWVASINHQQWRPWWAWSTQSRIGRGLLVLAEMDDSEGTGAGPSASGPQWPVFGKPRGAPFPPRDGSFKNWAAWFFMWARILTELLRLASAENTVIRGSLIAAGPCCLKEKQTASCHIFFKRRKFASTVLLASHVGRELIVQRRAS